MNLRGSLLLAAAIAALASGCDRAPGYPPDPVPRPDAVTDFATLYSQNCAACHGANGQNGPAIDLANPEYQALVDDPTLRKWISGGMPGTEMPAFAQSQGGMLTDAQVNALIAGMRQEWSRPNAFRRRDGAFLRAGTGWRRGSRKARLSGPLRILPLCFAPADYQPGLSRSCKRSGSARHHRRRPRPTLASPTGATSVQMEKPPHRFPPRTSTTSFRIWPACGQLRRKPPPPLCPISRHQTGATQNEPRRKQTGLAVAAKRGRARRR